MANIISDETIEYVGILAKLELSDEEKEDSDDNESDMTLKKVMETSDFTPEQRKELERAINDGIPEEYIMTYADPENSVIKMMTLRRQYQMNKEINTKNII